MDASRATSILIAGVWFLACVAALGFGFWCARCRHAWELVDKTEFPPPLKDVEEAGRAGLLWMSDIARLSYRVVVLALRCTKCGAARIVKETNKV